MTLVCPPGRTTASRGSRPPPQEDRRQFAGVRDKGEFLVPEEQEYVVSQGLVRGEGF